MSTTTFEGFSISHAAILDGTTGAEDADIYGVREGTLGVDEGSFDNTGDNAVLSTWFFLNFATVTIKAGYLSYEAASLVSGESITSSGAAPNDYYELPLWTDDSQNQSPKPLLIRIPSKDSAGVPRVQDVILYRVQFGNLKFDGPTYRGGLTVDYSGRAFVSTVDETGDALGNKPDGTPKRAVGRLVNRPQ